MKDELYFMAVAILSVWRQDDPAKYFAVIISDENLEDYEIRIIEKNMPKHAQILEIFQNIDYNSGYIFITMTPFAEIVQTAEAKNFDKIIYLPTASDVPASDSIVLRPFVYTFGRIIDVLSDYKPRVTFINTV